MKKVFFIAISVIIFTCLLFVIIKSTTADDRENDKSVYNIVENRFVQNEVDILYPSITGLADNQVEQRINDLLKTEAFFEYPADYSPEDPEEEYSFLSIEYKTLYQNNKYVCFSFTGLAYFGRAAYPRWIFDTINIDVKEGKRLKLSDMVNINYDFTQKVREAFPAAIEKDLAREVLYREQLGYDDDIFLAFLMGADVEGHFGCQSYFTDNSLVLKYSTSHSMGSFFEVELELEDIEKNLTKKGRNYLLK